jgi:hypothetical protein
MKKLLILICILLNTASVDSQTTQDTIDNAYWQTMMFDHTINIHKTRRAYDLYFSNKPKVKGTGHKQFERWYDYWNAKVDEFGNFPAPDRALTEYKKFLRNNLTARSTTGTWTNLGPLVGPPSTTGIPIGSGRICGIGYHATNGNIIYAGAPQGGFWRSTNKGVNWTSSTDNLPTLGVSDIAYIQNSTSDSVILIGTGDRDAGDANGLGVYKSTNGGVSFTASNTGMGNLTVNKLLVNKDKNTTIIAATSGGMYISYNQGASWVLKSVGSNFTDAKYCPSDTNIVYGTVSGAFYRSSNGGNTWGTIGTGFSGNARNRMAIAVSPDNGNVVYVVANRTSNTLDAVYKSTDKGLTFTTTATTPNVLSSQGWYAITIESSLTDVNTVFIGGLDLYKSTDGGVTFTSVANWTGGGGKPWVHADHHYLGRNPVNNELWIGHDGAIDYTLNEGSTFNHRDNGLSISQIYNLGVSQMSKTRFISGLQDNGSLVGSSTSTWNARVGGDGMQCEISNFDTMDMFANVQYGDLRRSTNGGTGWTDISATIPAGPGPWAAPCHLHPRVADMMIMLYKNANLSKNVVSAGTPTFNAITTGITSDGSAIRFSNVNNDLAFMGWSNGTVRYCANLSAGSPTTTLVTNPNGGNKVTDLETSFNNENVVFATAGTEVFKSTDKGVTWANISGNLPNITMYSIVLDKNSPEGKYVGTEAGVYYKDSLMANWILYNNGLPANSDIRDLEIVYDTTCTNASVLYAATYGRGLWKGDLYISETQPNPAFTMPTAACTSVPVNITNTTTSITNNGATTTYQWLVSPMTGVAFTGSTTNTSTDPQITFSTAGTYTVTLIATKPFGGFCRTFKTISVGNKGSIVLKTINDTTICPGDTVLVKVGGLKTYTFTPNTNVSIFNDSNAYLYPTSASNYMIVGSISGGCFDTTFVDVKMKPAPSYTMTGAKTFCAGDTTTISFTGVDTAYWNPATFTNSLSVTSKQVYPAANSSYNIRLVKSGLCDIKLIVPIKVLTKPVFALSKSGSQNLCIGDSMIVKSASIPNKVWTPSTTMATLSPDSFRFFPIVTTKYVISTTDTAYCPYVKDSVTFNMITPPVVAVSGPGAVCGGAIIKLIATGATTYNWSPNLYLSATNKDTVSCSPTSTLTYTITGSNGTCSRFTTKTINVGSSSVSLTITGKRDVCLGLGTKFVVSGASTYQWSPASLVSNEYSDTVKVVSTSTVTLTVLGETSGCKATDTVTLNVRPIPTVTATLSTKSPICAGSKVNVLGMGATTYIINPIYNRTVLKNDSFELKPLQTTKYFLKGYSQYGCSGNDSFIITVNPSPSITITPAVSTIDKGDSINITASGGNSYLWTPTKFIRTANNIATIRVKPDSNVVYNVKVTSVDGCVSNGIAIVYVSNKTKPNSGISNSDLENILIFPNPSRDIVTIESTEKVKTTIYNLVGAEVSKNIEYTESKKIDVSNIAAGNYMILLESMSGSKKMVKIEIVK